MVSPPPTRGDAIKALGFMAVGLILGLMIGVAVASLIISLEALERIERLEETE